MNEHSVNLAIDKLLFERSHGLAFFLILVLCFLAYANAIDHPFVHDDIVFIEQNPRIDKLDLRDIFTHAANSAGQGGLINTYWRPGLELFTRLQYRAFGLESSLYHLTNIILHGFNSILLYLVLDKLPVKSRPLALAVALVFLLHPIQSESVACVSGISNVLLALFMFLAFFSYLDWLDKGGLLRAGCCLAALALALLTKEQAVVVPALFLLHFILFKAERARTGAALVAGAFAVTALYFVLRLFITGSAVISRIALDGELLLRLASIPRALLVYARSLLLPYDLHYYRNLDVLAPKALPAVLFVLVLSALLVYLARTRSDKRLTAFALGFFLLSLLPMLNIVPLINEFSLVLTADHFLYIPIVGFAMFILIALNDFLRISPNVKRIIFALICMAYLSMTVAMNRFWAGEVPLFERTVEYEKEFARGHYLLGKAYYFNGQFARSIGSFDRALGIMRGYHEKTSDEMAKGFYKEFMKSINFDMAHSYTALAQYREALEHYLKALALDPHDGATYNNIGLAYINLGEAALSETYFLGALALDPGDMRSRNNLATLYAIQGRAEEALANFEILLRAAPEDPTVLNNYNQLRSRLQDSPEPAQMRRTE